MVEIKGIEKFAPRDFPGYITSTIFVGDCNFRCPFCHNSDLVLRPQTLASFPVDYFEKYLDSRKNWLEGICISGGEPLFHDDLDSLLQLIKKRNLLVKIDTNGSFPARLKKWIQKKLVDYVAMDVKGPLEKYLDVTRVKVNVKDIEKSIEIVKSSGLEYVFRMTVVPGLIDKEDIEKVGRMLKGTKLFQLQQFVPINTLDKSFNKIKPYPQDKLLSFAKVLNSFISEVKVEGI